MEYLSLVMSLINALGAWGLAGLLLMKSSRSGLTRSFALCAGLIGAWAMMLLLWTIETRGSSPVLFACELNTIMVFLPVMFLHLATVCSRSVRAHRLWLMMCYPITAALAWGVHQRWVDSPIAFESVPAWRYGLFAIFFAVVVGRAHWLLFRFQAAEPIPFLGLRLRRAFLGSYIGLLIGLLEFVPAYNLVVAPLVNGAMLVLLVSVACAIIEGNALDFKLAVTRASMLAATYGAQIGAPLLVGWWGKDVLQAWLGSSWWLVPLGVCLLLAHWGPLEYTFVWRRVEAQLLRGQRRYQLTLQRAARGMTRVRDVEKLSRLITRIVSRSVQLTHASLFIWNKVTEQYVLHASYGPNRLATQSRYRLDRTHPLITWLIEHRQVLTEEMPGQGVHPDIPAELNKMGAALVIPGLIEDQLIGFLALGHKLSGMPYSHDDLHAFSTLANEATMAIENALSYDELLKVNEQLKAASERLVRQERLAVIGQFAAGLAHEIKNPLSAVKTFAQYLPEKYNDPTFREKFFRIVQSEIDRINSIVVELSDFAKPAPLQLEPVHLPKLVDDTLTLLSNHCLRQGIDVRMRFESDGLLIQGDVRQLKQVLLNLCLNSLEAMPSGGQLEITTWAKRGRLMLRVQDTGAGISAENQQRIWDPFFTTKERGMGLGLAIVKGIIERHRGTIALSSVPDKGTTFDLSLPLSKQPGNI